MRLCTPRISREYNFHLFCLGAKLHCCSLSDRLVSPGDSSELRTFSAKHSCTADAAVLLETTWRYCCSMLDASPTLAYMSQAGAPMCSICMQVLHACLLHGGGAEPCGRYRAVHIRDNRHRLLRDQRRRHDHVPAAEDVLPEGELVLHASHPSRATTQQKTYCIPLPCCECLKRHARRALTLRALSFMLHS